MTAVACHGHVFVPFKGEESICWACGWVTWPVASFEEADAALRDQGGGTCPGTWHGRHGGLPRLTSRRKRAIMPAGGTDHA